MTINLLSENVMDLERVLSERPVVEREGRGGGDILISELGFQMSCLPFSSLGRIGFTWTISFFKNFGISWIDNSIKGVFHCERAGGGAHMREGSGVGEGWKGHTVEWVTCTSVEMRSS